jgi:mannosyltransferase OCH1-like enzyme
VIPKVLHFVWVGDESKRPDNCINTWRVKNPDYQIKIWGNHELDSHPWLNAKHMKKMYLQELCGVADMMRYEILYCEGGITLDADSICINPLEDWLLKPDAFACWEQELTRPNLVGVGTMGSVPKNSFFRECAIRLSALETVTNNRAWITTGPSHLTSVFKDTEYGLTIYPSHYFTKKHFDGLEYTGNGHCFAKQLWGSTLGYDNIS